MSTLSFILLGHEKNVFEDGDPSFKIRIYKSNSEAQCYQITKQVRLRLPDEDSDKGLKLVPGSHGMNVPSACTIVIIAGFKMIPNCNKKI